MKFYFTMKTYFYFFIIFLTTSVCRVLADPAIDVWGIQTNGVQLSIGLKGGADVVEYKKPVELVIKLKNQSTNTFDIFKPIVPTESDGSFCFLSSLHHLEKI